MTRNPHFRSHRVSRTPSPSSELALTPCASRRRPRAERPASPSTSRTGIDAHLDTAVWPLSPSRADGNACRTWLAGADSPSLVLGAEQLALLNVGSVGHDGRGAIEVIVGKGAYSVSSPRAVANYSSAATTRVRVPRLVPLRQGSLLSSSSSVLDADSTSTL